MISAHNPGRVAGFLYLLLAVAGLIRILYIPSKLFVEGDVAARATNIAAHQSLECVIAFHRPWPRVNATLFKT
jgi:hypothetical protein